MKLQNIVVFFLLLIALPLFAQNDTITVTGQKQSGIEKSGTTTTITGKDIEDKSSKVLKDELVYIPGMQVETQRKGTRTFSMRGYSMSKVAMLVDGIPVMDTYSGSFDIDNIGLLDVSDIIVTRGTSSALYGARGTVGSVNIIKAPPKKMYVNVAGETDHLYNRVLSVSHGMPIGDFYYMLSASYDKSDGYTVSKKLDRKTREDWFKKLSRYDLYGWTINDFLFDSAGNAVPYYLEDSGKWDHRGHEKYKTNGKIGYHITDKLETGISAFYNKSEMNNSTYSVDMYPVYRHNKIDGYRQWVPPSMDSALRNVSSRWPDYDDYALSPFINYKGDSFELKLNAFYYEQNNKYISYVDPKENYLQGSVSIERQTWSFWQNSTYGFNIYPTYKISKDNKLNFAVTYYIGSHLEYEQALNSNSTEILTYYGDGKYKTMEISASYLTLAVEDEIKFGNAVELSMGVSYDAQDVIKYRRKNNQLGSTEMLDRETGYVSDPMLWGTQDSFSPVIGIVARVTNDLQLRGSASYKTSFPSLQAYASTDSASKVGETEDDTSYEKLKPEKSVNGNVGVEIAFLDHTLTLGCDYFYSYYWDRLVRFYETKNKDDYVYRNMDYSYLHGAETTLKWNGWDMFDKIDISLALTHTYIYARNLTKMHFSNINKGVYFEKLPEHKFTIDFRMNIIKTRTSLFVFGYYECGQIQYALKYVPNGGFTTDCWDQVALNNPLMIDVKISQKIYSNYGDYEAYLMCKNIMDDYLMDPFNPGPGRMFYAGLKAGW